MLVATSYELRATSYELESEETDEGTYNLPNKQFILGRATEGDS